jgi:hypothetical protein
MYKEAEHVCTVTLCMWEPYLGNFTDQKLQVWYQESILLGAVGTILWIFFGTMVSQTSFVIGFGLSYQLHPLEYFSMDVTCCPIKHGHGLRQGDSLCPHLFVLAIDPIHHIISKARYQCLLHPLWGATASTRASLYADNVVVFVASTLASFLDVTSMNTNCIKSLWLRYLWWSWPWCYFTILHDN